MIDTTTKAVRDIGQLNYVGNIIPHTWYKHLCKQHKKPKKDEYVYKPYLEAIVILSDIIYWYRPSVIRDESTGEIVAVKKKFKADQLQRSYRQLSEMFGIGKDQARNAIKFLESLDLIKLDLRTININGLVLSNVLFIKPVPETIKYINQADNTPICKLADSSPPSEQTPSSESKGTYTKNIPENLHTELDSLNPESNDSDSNESMPIDKSHLDNRGVFIHKFVDNEYTEFTCCCGITLDVRHLKKTRLQCPTCETPIEIRDSHGTITHKPLLAKKRQRVLGDIIPDCPEKLADIRYQTNDQENRIKLMLTQNRGILLNALNWAVNKYITESWSERMIIDNGLSAAGKKINVSLKPDVQPEKKGEPDYSKLEIVEPEWMKL